MMLAAWGLLTDSVNVKAMGPARTLLVSAANGAAVLLFIASGVVRWPETLGVAGWARSPAATEAPAWRAGCRPRWCAPSCCC